MCSGLALRLMAVALVAIAFVGGLYHYSSGDEPASSKKATGTTGGQTGSTDPPESWGPTTIVDTDCNLVPATTMLGDLGGGHIACPRLGNGQQPPIPPDTPVPSPNDGGGGVITGTLTEDGTGAVLPGVVVLSEPAIAVATGADGRFGVAVEVGTYHLSAVVNRDVSYACSTLTVKVTEGNAADVAMTCHH